MEKIIDGKTIIIDDIDAEWFERVRWRIAPNGYAYSTVYLHRIIAKPPLHMQVDHINRNKLDNSRLNLRVVTLQENMENRMARRFVPGKYPKAHTSKFVGVCWMKRNKKWRATFRGKHMGLFKSEEEASKAYNKVAYPYYNDPALSTIV